MHKKIIQLHDIDPTTLVDNIVSQFNTRIDQLEKSLNPPKSEWITRQQAGKLLGVSLVTINDWSNKGILKRYHIGGRVKYKLQEIENTLNSSRDESVS
ncbi:MAG: helix-turn-helix domain-containing protein [Patiriisocius sp.]|uniref:helix-turn-helix domain-containing protein n=1 Tax=Patiriisocius sp. TaxID=2822396 RepID=UPI003EF0FB22